MTDISVEFRAKVTMFDVLTLEPLDEAKKDMVEALYMGLGEYFEEIHIDADSIKLEYVERRG